MKLLFVTIALAASFMGIAQPKLITKAIISTTTNVIVPEEEDVSQIQPQGQGGGMNFRNFLDGEMKSTTYIKDELTKTSIKSETMKSSIFRNNATKTTTTIYEIMGNTQGVVSNDEEQEQMKKQMDSMIAARAKTDTAIKQRVRTVDVATTVTYLEETKKIAGYNCKKALLITDRFVKRDTLAVWYTPDIKFANVPSTGGLAGVPMMRMMSGGGAANFDKINGFVMMYETKMPRGRTMEVKVTKIEIDKDIAAKEFDIPKDVEIKTMKEMQSGGAMRFMAR